MLCREACSQSVMRTLCRDSPAKRAGEACSQSSSGEACRRSVQSVMCGQSRRFAGWTADGSQSPALHPSQRSIPSESSALHPSQRSIPSEPSALHPSPSQGVSEHPGRTRKDTRSRAPRSESKQGHKAGSREGPAPRPIRGGGSETRSTGIAGVRTLMRVSVSQASLTTFSTELKVDWNRRSADPAGPAAKTRAESRS
jgi:hypothetical protein